MLISFQVSNYLSFKDEVTLSFQAASIKEYDESNLTYNEEGGFNILKGGALYGANAAGKSNVIKALAFVKQFILKSSSRNPTDKIGVQFFLLATNTSNTPSTFVIDFIVEKKRYKYAFSTDNDKVHSEILYEVLKTREKILFKRLNDKYEFDDSFKTNEDLKEMTRPNALYLTIAAQFNNTLASIILKWFDNLTFVDDGNTSRNIQRTASFAENPKGKRLLLNILKIANLGFDDLEIKRVKLDDEVLNIFPKEVVKQFFSHQDILTISTVHKKYDHLGNFVGNVQFDLAKDESLGTQKYFALAGYIIDSLQNGKPLIIDELDARLHPLLSSLIVTLFNSVNNNPKNAQLIFSTNNVSLLSQEVLRRDQVFILQKNAYGATEIKSLHERKARKDGLFEKDYLAGEYEGIPFNKLPKDINLFLDSY